ncbi:hypothetical protein PQI07_12605 [Methylobacterium sp. 092160098-2]|uniref:hypothetical protein n=1 Tax=Methylobacterium sp. 092160098-2 TaxID=3025129 RepID=UPI0023819F63|nr:hypothetical protein [Methylobacterium sp. 092160098-2]MDE4911530.1 hypothetical protein [Methylobacterium sp. 092160098-2]
MVPVPPRRHARPHAALGAGLSLLALFGAPAVALAQGAGAVQGSPVPPLAVPVAVPPAATGRPQGPGAPDPGGEG